ncbi:MAG: glycosyltransferase family 4 protein, partial [Saprospiraceae bacterium]|nr:glycosyltransferase family 4 protein [Saprospiraceae bacterium]
ISNSKYFQKLSYKLIIAGNNTNLYFKELEELVEKLNLSKSIEFIGEVMGEEKENLLAKSYFLILPSDSENFGNVVIEALAQGTPVITTKGTPWEVLEKRNAGFWVENTPLHL